MSHILSHALLGVIRGKVSAGSLVQYLGIPYASVPSRFARSQLLTGKLSPNVFDATLAGSESVQPENATESDASGNQFPHDGFKEAPQSENCLYLNITTPLSPPDKLLPVVVFIHGGAFFLGSGSRPYYDPLSFLARADQTQRNVVFVSINYRLSTLGFLHSPDVPETLPANNALHDQIRAFEWIHKNIKGFGGDPGRITAIGQSAGGMSLSLHSLCGNETALFHQMICMSGSPVTMPTKTPKDYKETFHDLAKKLGVDDPAGIPPKDLAEVFIRAPVGKIRDLGFIGAPCTSSELLPYPQTSMKKMRSKPESGVRWIKRAIYSSATYDGGVSYNILASTKKDNGRTFTNLVKEKMSSSGAERLLVLYGITESQEDADALERICQFESDVGFFFASQAQVSGSPAQNNYLQIFDLPNPFDAGGSLAKDRFATHTWDIVALLGKYDDQLKPETLEILRNWRDKVLDFVYEEEPWIEWDEKNGKALRVSKQGVKVEGVEGYLEEEEGRRRNLTEIAKDEKGEDGLDFLWEGVCRQWLDG